MRIEKMPLALLKLGWVCLLLAGCGGGGGDSQSDGIGGDPENYFPLAPGNRWVYQVTVSENGWLLPSYSTAVKVTGTRVIRGETAQVLTESNPDNSGQAIAYYVVQKKDGVFDYGDEFFSEPIPGVLPYKIANLPLRPNDSFVQMDVTGLDYGEDLDGDGRSESIAIISRVKVVGLETVTVAAGTFSRCAKVQTAVTETLTFSHTGQEVSINALQSEWYAPGVGLVRRSLVISYQNWAATTIEEYELTAYFVDGKRSEDVSPEIVLAQPEGTVRPAGASSVSVRFSEEMDPSTINSQSFVVTDPTGGSVPGQAKYSKQQATFIPAEPFPSGTFRATIFPAAEDLAGNGLADEYSWTFTVDWTAPVIATDPAPGAVGVSNLPHIKVDFSEDMNRYSLNGDSFILRSLSGDLVAGYVSSNTRSATFIPYSRLETGGTYAATITTAAKDASGSSIYPAYSWSFTVDDTVPSLIAISPPDGAVDVSNVLEITAVFDEEMDPSTLDSYSFFLLDPAGSKVWGSISYSNRTATFIPIRMLERGDRYTAVITTEARGVTGIPLSSERRSSFTVDPGFFLPWTSIGTGSKPQAVAIGDVNGDGSNDVVLVTAFYFDPSNDFMVFVFPQNAAGGLDSPLKYSTRGSLASYPSTIAIGDLNGDSRNDVVVGYGSAGIEVFLQNDSGGLAPGEFYETADSYKVRIADLNGDGRMDVVGVGPGTGTVTISYQNEGGTLDPPVTYAANHSGWEDLEIGDLNNDGKVDIIVTAGMYPTPTVGILLQAADGSFGAPAYYGTAQNRYPNGVAVGDINGDSLIDVVVTAGGNIPSSSIRVFHQKESNGFDPVIDYDSYDIPIAVQVADVDGDGRNDVVILHNAFSAIGVYRQGDNGELSKEALYRAPTDAFNPQALAAGDINGDGGIDLAIADYNYGLVLLYNKGTQVRPAATGAQKNAPVFHGWKLRRPGVKAQGISGAESGP